MRAALALADSGLCLAHAMAQALGGRYGLPQGAMNAVCLPAALRFNAEAVPEAVARFARGARRGRRSDAHRGAARLGGFERLRDFGVPEAELDDVAVAIVARPGARRTRGRRAPRRSPASCAPSGDVSGTARPRRDGSPTRRASRRRPTSQEGRDVVERQRMVARRDRVEHLHPAPRGEELGDDVGPVREPCEARPEGPGDGEREEGEIGDGEGRAGREPVAEGDAEEREGDAAEDEGEQRGGEPPRRHGRVVDRKADDDDRRHRCRREDDGRQHPAGEADEQGSRAACGGTPPRPLRGSSRSRPRTGRRSR